MADAYFSDYFGIKSSVLDKHGALNISLVGDLPLFVDPFLLFNSEKDEYRSLHEEIIRYMRFLKEMTLTGGLDQSLIDSWFSFPEVRQNWLGFSVTGNEGRGLGRDFARALHRSFNSVFRNFGEETVSRSSHLEKLCLIRDGVGRDNISDFTTNLIKPFLAAYTERFARDYIPAGMRRMVAVPKVHFNYTTRSWMPHVFELPFINGDYVLLTPKDLLTKDEAWINRPDLINQFVDIAEALPNGVLRAQVNQYLMRVIPTEPDAKQDRIRAAIAGAIERFPQILDYYIRNKEDSADEASSVAQEKVAIAESCFVRAVGALIQNVLTPGGFYRIQGNTYQEARQRLLFLKDVIENKGGHRVFYMDGQPIEREADLQVMYRLTWFATPSDISREVNDGRGPADFKVSRGAADKALVEFKLANNKQLERNLAKQVEVYERASDATHPSLKAILYFSGDQLQRVQDILRRLKLQDNRNIILIDACSDNKPAGSKA